MIELNDILYNKLFSYANWIIRDEDVAADAVATIIMKLPTYTGTTEQNFNTWSTTIINNKLIDLKRSEKRNKIQLIQSEEAHHLMFENLESHKPADTFYMDKIKSILSEEEIEFMMSYCESKVLKTNADKLKFHYLKQKILKGQKTTFYLLKNVITGQTFKSKSFTDIAKYLDLTSEAIRQAFKDNRLVCKSWKIELVEEGDTN